MSDAIERPMRKRRTREQIDTDNRAAFVAKCESELSEALFIVTMFDSSVHKLSPWVVKSRRHLTAVVSAYRAYRAEQFNKIEREHRIRFKAVHPGVSLRTLDRALKHRPDGNQEHRLQVQLAWDRFRVGDGAPMPLELFGGLR